MWLGSALLPISGNIITWCSSSEGIIAPCLVGSKRRGSSLERKVTGLEEFADRQISDMSGGQRQRVWIAMSLAQGTETLVLDEPTTYLDLAHQLDILLLLQKLNIEEHRTIIMVLHDLNHASRFSDYMIAMKDGDLITEGSPDDVMTHDNLRTLFNIEADIQKCPYSGHPIFTSYHLSSRDNNHE